jgi:hypothetical protein
MKLGSPTIFQILGISSPIKTFKNLDESSRSRIKKNNSLSVDFPISKRLHQRCYVPSILLRIYVFKALHVWK